MFHQTHAVTLSLPFIAGLALFASCARPAAAPRAASAPPSTAASQAQPGRGPLASLASQPLIVLPVQTLRVGIPDWSAAVGEERTYLANVDDEIAFAVRERALRGKWAFPADLARSAKRNPGFAADPYAIAVDALKPVERDPKKLIGEPLAGQLRALAGLWDARFALVPSEMRLEPDSAGGRAVVHLVVVDVRQASITWKGDVSGDAVRTFSPAVAAGVAGRIADLFTAR